MRASAREARRIEEGLLAKPSGEALMELVDAYELERAVGPDSPTRLYEWLRDRLQREWHERRNVLL